MENNLEYHQEKHLMVKLSTMLTQNPPTASIINPKYKKKTME